MAEIRTTKETYIETTGKKSYPVEVTRLRSDEPWEYEVAPGQWKLVDAVTIFDAGKEGTSLVVVTHDPEVGEVAQRIVRLEHGKVHSIEVNKNFQN